MMSLDAKDSSAIQLGGHMARTAPYCFQSRPSLEALNTPEGGPVLFVHKLYLSAKAYMGVLSVHTCLDRPMMV